MIGIGYSYAGDTGGVDDASEALAFHDRSSMLHAQERPTQEQGNRTIETFYRDSFNGTKRTSGASIVEHAVEPAEILHGSIDCSLNIGFPGYVSVEIDSVSSQLPGDTLTSVVLNICYQNAGTFLYEEPR